MAAARNVMPFALVAAALLAACADVSSPTATLSRPGTPMASKGSGGGGGSGGSGSGGSTSGTQLVVTTPPTVDATGTFVGTSDGPDVTHTYTFVLQQTSAGMVSGVETTTTPFMTSQASVVGTVNADTLMLYVGTTCSSCTLSPYYQGIVAPDASRIDGNFVNGGVSPVTMFRQ